MLQDGGLDGILIGADDLADFLAVLEDDEGGHGADAELLGHVGDLVDVELVEAHGRVLVGELGDDGGDDLARAAPRRKAINQQRRWVLDRRVVFLSAAKNVSPPI